MILKKICRLNSSNLEGQSKNETRIKLLLMSGKQSVLNFIGKICIPCVRPVEAVFFSPENSENQIG